MKFNKENTNDFDALDIADDWKTPMFRQRIINEMDNVMQRLGSRANLKSGEMENRIFSKVKTREEYLKAMAYIIASLKKNCNSLIRNPISIDNQNQTESNSHTGVQDGTPLTRAQALWITKQTDLVNECILELRRFFVISGFGNLLRDVENKDWKSPEFRRVVKSKIEDEFQKSGLKLTRDSTFMENRVFLISKSFPEYIKTVSRLIVHVRNLTKQNQNPDPDVTYLMSIKTYQTNSWLAEIDNQKY